MTPTPTRMTVADIVSNERFRNDLHEALSHPCVQIALDALAEENMPELVIKTAAGMTVSEAIALEFAKRAGAQSMIRRLRKLPFLTPKVIRQSLDQGRPWEYLEPAPAPEAKPTKKK